MIRFDGPGELGIIFWDKIIELTGLLNGEAWGRTSDRQLRIFKSDAGQHCGRCFRTSSFQRNRREKRRTGIVHLGRMSVFRSLRYLPQQTVRFSGQDLVRRPIGPFKRP
jgi:hypothetical protein